MGVLATVAFALAGAVSAAGLLDPTTTHKVTPQVKSFPGDRLCPSGTLVKDQFQSLTQNSASGEATQTYTINGQAVTVKLTWYADKTFDFLVTGGLMHAVFVQGGGSYLLYQYDPPVAGATNTGPVTSDTGLHAGVNAQGAFQDVSHVDFCLSERLEPLKVSKTASTSFTRTFQWNIDKSVTPATWNLFRGDSGTSDYTVQVTKTGSTDSAHAVSGTIAIENPNSTSVTITGVSDQISGGINATVSCPVSFPHTLAGGGTLNCSYSASLPDGSNRTNTATVTTSGSVADASGTAAVTFGAPTTTVNGTIDVTDSVQGNLGSLSDSGSFAYSRTFDCDEDDGTHGNTATIVETGQSDSASVTVDCHALDVTKTASTALTRTWQWTIDKSVDPAAWDLFSGDSGTSEYTVAVTKSSSADSAAAVSGTISVENPAPIAATINAVTDVVSPSIAATVDCGVIFPHSLPAGQTLTCDYSAPLPDTSSRTNTATATLQNHGYASNGVATATGTTDFSGTAAVSFASATITEVNASVNVDDTNGMSWQFNASGSQTYTQTFGCDEDEGTQTNTATIRETGQSDAASVTVDCHALEVTKSANTSLTRTWGWTIDKSADPATLSLSDGQLATVDYEVMVDATSTDSDHAVSGTISVKNPAPIAATITGVTDVVSPSVAATVDCGVTFPHSLPAGQTLTCSYSASLPDASARTNTATATLQNRDYDSEGAATASGTTDFSGTAAVGFASATATESDECVDVSDTNVGSLGTVCAADAPRTFTYSLSFGRNAEADVELACGANTHTNTATFVTNDSETSGSDTATVGATVTCAAPPPPPPPPPVVDLAVTKADNPDPVTVNNQLSYTLVVTNNGPSTATGVRVADTLPASATYVSATSEQGSCSLSAAVVTCDIGTMAAGASVRITVVVRPTATGTILNTAVVTGNESESTTANNQATEPTLVVGVLQPPTPTCSSLTVRPRQLFVGRRTTITARVRLSNNTPFARARVRVVAPGIRVTRLTNRQGIARISVQPTRPGIARVSVVANPRCSVRRVGIVGVFRPPVTG